MPNRWLVKNQFRGVLLSRVILRPVGASLGGKFVGFCFAASAAGGLSSCRAFGAHEEAEKISEPRLNEASFSTDPVDTQRAVRPEAADRPKPGVKRSGTPGKLQKNSPALTGREIPRRKPGHIDALNLFGVLVSRQILRPFQGASRGR